MNVICLASLEWWWQSFDSLAGYPDEPLWLSSDLFGSGSTIYHELDVVWEDHKGIEESLGKKTLTDVAMYQICSSHGRSDAPPPTFFIVHDRCQNKKRYSDVEDQINP